MGEAKRTQHIGLNRLNCSDGFASLNPSSIFHFFTFTINFFFIPSDLNVSSALPFFFAVMINVASPLSFALTFSGDTDIRFLPAVLISVFIVTPSGMQPSLPVSVTVTSLLVPTLRVSLFSESVISPTSHPDVGVGMGVVAEAERLLSSFDTKASKSPSREVSYAPIVVGKSEPASPVIYTFPLVSRVRE